MISADATCSQMLYILFHRSTKSHGIPVFAGWRDVEESGTALASHLLRLRPFSRQNPSARIRSRKVWPKSSREVRSLRHLTASASAVGSGDPPSGAEFVESPRKHLSTSSPPSINFIGMTASIALRRRRATYASPSAPPLLSIGPPNCPDCRDTRSLDSPDVLAVSLRRHRLDWDLTLHAGYEEKSVSYHE